MFKCVILRPCKIGGKRVICLVNKLAQASGDDANSILVVFTVAIVISSFQIPALPRLLISSFTQSPKEPL